VVLHAQHHQHGGKPADDDVPLMPLVQTGCDAAVVRSAFCMLSDTLHIVAAQIPGCPHLNGAVTMVLGAGLQACCILA
jgi:hypothetical protein